MPWLSSAALVHWRAASRRPQDKPRLAHRANFGRLRRVTRAIKLERFLVELASRIRKGEAPFAAM
jgi:hypothetical protein